MSSEDHLDKETSITVKIDESGVEAKSKSRLVSAADRMLGNVAEWVNVRLEKNIGPERARIEAHKKIIEAAANSAVTQIENDSEFGNALFESELSKITRRHANKQDVIEAATEQLKLAPPTKEEAESGEDELSPEFVNRFERYAEDASTEDAQLKWANTLAAEVRKPGTVSYKVMRILDEIDSNTANIFKEMCATRVGHDIVTWLYEPSFKDKSSFTSYELMTDSFPGVIRFCTIAKTGTGRECYLFGFGPVAIMLTKEGAKERITSLKCPELLIWHDEKNLPAIPIINITSPGRSLMDIMEDNSIENAKTILRKIQECDPEAQLLVLSSDKTKYEAMI